MRTADAWCHNLNTNKHKQHFLVMSSLQPGSLVLLDEWSTQHTLINVFLFIQVISLTYVLLLKSSFALTPCNYSVWTALTRSVSHSFKHSLTHVCSLPCLAIAGCLNHTLFRHSSTVTYPLYTTCPFLICCHAFTLFLTHTVSYSHTLDLLTISNVS